MVSEDDRHRLEVLGSTVASTLMGYLPPLGWGDVATKDDLPVLSSEMTARFAIVEAKIDGQNRNLFLAMLTLQLTAFGLVLAASHLV